MVSNYNAESSSHQLNQLSASGNMRSNNFHNFRNSGQNQYQGNGQVLRRKG
jgi:hypothetical protein